MRRFIDEDIPPTASQDLTIDRLEGAAISIED